MIDVEEYLKRQIEVYQANKALENRLENREQRPGRGKKGDLFYGPYLIVSREKGAGGNTVARLAGKRLGWQVFNNEIVDEIAKKAHVRRQLIESLDEHDRETIQAIVQDTLGQLLNLEEMAASDYVVYLRQVVLALGHQGDVVIVGHGARFILPSEFGLCVRMVAPIEARIQRIAEKTHLSPKAVRVEIEKTDRERKKLVHCQFGCDVTDPLSHDLIINTVAISAEAAAEIVVAALQRKLGVQIKDSGQT